MKFIQSVMDSIAAHAAECFPKESCGLVIIFKGKQRYVPCHNRAERNEHFIIDEQDWADAEDMGEIVAVVHSHPSGNPIPSQADLVGIEKSGLPWIIVNHPVGHYTITEPSGYEAPLVGREFSHNVLDCYTLLQDYYWREFGIPMKDYVRPDEWWHRGMDMYRENFEDCGFIEVPLESIQPGDILFMKVAANVENHGAIYLGDNLILHHPMNRLSSRDVYGGYWRKITVRAVRHKARV